MSDPNPLNLDRQTTDELALCPHCSAQMPETSAFCPACGRTIESLTTQPSQLAQGSVGWFPENIAGALAYFTFIPALLFLAAEPYKQNRFLRFQSAQCLLLWVAAAVAASIIRLTGLLLVAIPVVGPLAVVLLWVLSAIFVAITWLVLVVKAFQGEMFRLPILGAFAEKHAEMTQL